MTQDGAGAKYTTKWSRTHYKNGTKSLCGLGYDWPSSISLTSDWTKVDCKVCHKCKSDT